ncbi:hypothetical protein B0H13DRAFT_2110106 [Mycena leptocephala]|nr:hypothetical protein B0H13DRAFT_2110106 [Mycena leptocephala]
MREPLMRDDTRPGILILARKDYAFSIPPGYRPRDMEWTAGCESSSLVKVGDYRIPENGCLEFRDKIAHGIPKLPGHFEVLSGAGDGIYPVEIIKDPQGIIACIKVRFDGQGDVNVEGPELRLVRHDSLAPYSNPKERVLSEKDSSARKRRRKSTSFLKDLGSAARGVL